MTTTVELARMTWKQAEAARDRKAVVLIPLGTLEQNGSVCPLGIDTLVAEEVSKRVASETASLITPSISFGYSPQFRRFPGTISLSPQTIHLLLTDIVRNLIENGFDHLAIINCHLINEPIIEHVAREVRERFGVVTASVNPITLAQTLCADLYAGLPDAAGHGAEPIASMFRSFATDAIHLDLAETDTWKSFQGLPVTATSKVKVGAGIFSLYFRTDEVAVTGGTGDPTASDPVRGEEIMRRVTRAIAEYVRTFASLKASTETGGRARV